MAGDYESPVQVIEHAGIPQGSPLSPILYVFYNENLVQGCINKSEGFLDFIDKLQLMGGRAKRRRKHA